MYGPRGFVQYQVVVPFGAEDALRARCSSASAARRGLVPRRPQALRRGNAGLLSFPIAGWTLALDIPRARAGSRRCSTGSTRSSAGAGGRVYLAKDARAAA